MFKVKCTDKWLKKAVKLEKDMDISAGNVSELERIKKLTELGKQEKKEAAAQREMHRLLVEKQEKDEKARRFKENVKWQIDSTKEGIEKAAKKGKNKFTLELGRETSEERETAELVAKNFQEFNPKIRIERVDFDNQVNLIYEVEFGELRKWWETHLRIDFTW